MLKLDLLRAFATVTRHGRLKDAGEELGRTQSALSMSLAQLEDQLGGKLFETDRKTELTDLGLYVRDLSDELLRENDRIQNLIMDYARGHSGRLRIASVPSVAALILPTLLRDFMKIHHAAEVELTDSDSASVRSMVDQGDADIGIAGAAKTGQSLRKEPLFEDRLHVVCQVGVPLAISSGHLCWQDLEGNQLIANETLAAIDVPATKSLLAQSSLSARNVSSLFAMVQNGLGYTVLPGLATRQLSEGLIAMPMNGPGCNREVSLLTRNGRTLSPLALDFRSFLLRNIPRVISQYQLTLTHLHAGQP